MRYTAHEPPTPRLPPGFTERTSFGTRTLDPYAKLVEGRIVLLGTPVDETAAGDVVAQLRQLEHAAPDQDISLYINSPGGSFGAATSVYDTLRIISCDVATVCLGQAGSVAAVLLAAGTPGKRSALPGARIVMREPSIEEPVQGTPSDLLIRSEELLRRRRVLHGILARHTGRGEDDVAALLDRDTVFDATAAREFGLVDHVMGSRDAGLGRVRPGR